MNPVVDFEFVPPREAPIFYPTSEDFKDPLKYISNIRPKAEEFGICKIKPPSDWNPPFAVDIKNFKFTPRVQRLNELQATTRLKLNFLDQIAKFWDLQGSKLKIPNVERKSLDLFTLYKIVSEEGGPEIASRERRWSHIAVLMGYPAGRGIGSLLRAHYERVLYPYYVFQQGTNPVDLNLKQYSDDYNLEDKDYIPHGIPSREALKSPEDRYARRVKRRKETEENLEGIDYSTNNELRKLQFYGAGPKMPGFHGPNQNAPMKDGKPIIHNLKPEKCKSGNVSDDDKNGVDDKSSTEHLKVATSPDSIKLQSILKKDKPQGNRPIEAIVCSLCEKGDSESSMLLCDGCEDSYHTFCLAPPLNDIPKGDWRCPRCLAKEVNKPLEAFGFEQAKREYTLCEFGLKADDFKTNYFKSPVHEVPYDVVEKEFWRVLNAIDEDVVVEYGADLHSITHGSGFPKLSNDTKLSPEQETYAKSGWNLNNLPVLENSVLRHINADISGMKVPWTYVGMCFAAFCWHNEDHWSYSINYLHWGEPKTWYGVPGNKAVCFENAMHTIAPDLFKSQPDLLHQLVTIMNPNILAKLGVPICRTNQQPGEFVVTFPRSYHAGFNQGYNFAEAVNFATADWLPVGRACMTHYSQLLRYCVFSHDELICQMAANAKELQCDVAAAAYLDMFQMIKNERDLRREILKWGVTAAQRETFEVLPDDERLCVHCKTTCYLSALSCTCDRSRLVCLPHKEELCDCPRDNYILMYRYLLDELPPMLSDLKYRAESYDAFVKQVYRILNPRNASKVDRETCLELINEHAQTRLPMTAVYDRLDSAVKESIKLSELAQEFIHMKEKPRTRSSVESPKKESFSLDSLPKLIEKLNSSVIKIKEEKQVQDYYGEITEFQKQAKKLIDSEDAENDEIEKCIDLGNSLVIDLSELPILKMKLQHQSYLQELNDCLNGERIETIEVLNSLLSKEVPCNPIVDKARSDVHHLIGFASKFEEKAKNFLNAKPKLSLQIIEAFIGDVNQRNLPVHMPNLRKLIDSVKKAKEWMKTFYSIQSSKLNICMDILECLVSRGKSIAVRFDVMPNLELQLEGARVWKDKTTRTFLKKTTAYSLLEVLSPRKDIGLAYTSKKRKRRIDVDKSFEDDGASFEQKLNQDMDQSKIVSTYQDSEKLEIETMLKHRDENIAKQTDMNSVFCYCRKAPTSNMMQCELCKDWYHVICAGNRTVGKKFLCTHCCRSRRPRLEIVYALLIALQKLPVRLPEGEVLLCLSERAIAWQNQAQQILKCEEVTEALKKLNSHNDHRYNVSDNGMPHTSNGTSFPGSGSHTYDGIEVIEIDPESPPSVEEICIDPPTAPPIMEHAYSNMSKVMPLPPAPAPRKQPRKTPLVARQGVGNLLLGQKMISKLERLQLEGDLLEITLDESTDIWRLLEAAKPPTPPHFPFHEINNIEDIIVEKKKSKKLKSAESKAESSKPKKRKSENKEKKKEKMPRSKKAKNEDSSEDMCSSQSCLRPIAASASDSVHWIQCDGGCEGWFHMVCVGLDHRDVLDTEDFICPHCRQQSFTDLNITGD